MKDSVKSIEVFERQAKKMVKKYASLKNELKELVQKLATYPQSGIPLGNNCFKILEAGHASVASRSGC
ncbi:MAG: hypothetical protein LBJ00_00470 [Planctomycetaceae bacterium]|jgi:bifunctional ADP-heptose synthase (sugar kinase/adenylyltransferase)|nr:hypothetical protein [Planctomycetaceae bacterium]